MSIRKPVYNYPLPPEYYVDDRRSVAMASQRSSISTDSNYSHSSADSHGALVSSQHYGSTRHATSTQATNQYSPPHFSHSQNGQRSPSSPSTTLSEKGDKELQFCPECSKSFTRKADVVRHRKTVHQKEEYFDCPKNNCARKGTNGFTRADHRKEHLRGYHGDPIPKRQNGRTDRACSRDA